MSEIRVTLPQLESRIKELECLNAQFSARINELTTLESSLTSMWQGEANDSFHRAFMNDRCKMVKLYNLIIVYIAILREIRCNYIRTENTNTCIGNKRTYRC